MLVHPLGLCSSHAVICAHWLHFGVVDCPHILASFFVLGLCIAAIVLIVCYVVDAPWFGLLLSCFGHNRAKNNSVLPCGLELCSSFVWDCIQLFFLLHRTVKGLFCYEYAVVGLRTVLAWPIVEGLSNPTVFGLLTVSPWLCVSLH